MLYRYLKLDESKYADVSLPFADLDIIPEYAIPAVKALYTEGRHLRRGEKRPPVFQSQQRFDPRPGCRHDRPHPG